MRKFLDQIEADWQRGGAQKAASSTTSESIDMSEERATILYFLDTLNKYLIEVDTQPIRKVRETLDDFAKELIKADESQLERILFRLRQFISSHRIEEYTYVQKTFDDFKAIIWDFADQLGEDIRLERIKDQEVKASLDDLREAVESNSIDELRMKSREFIDFYVEYQNKRDERREKRMSHIKKSLNSAKKQLLQAYDSMKYDHLTKAHNRKSFDETIKNYIRLAEASKQSVSLLALDIDFFKKINDSYGHDTGDVALRELVNVLKGIFTRDNDLVARIGGEEFAVVLPDYKVEHAVKKAEEVLAFVRKKIFVHGEKQFRFTVSIGIAQHLEGESAEQWLKRADAALYHAKNSGRDRFIVAPHSAQVTHVA